MLQNKSFGFCLLLLLLFRTGLDCKMDGTEKGGGGEFDPISQRPKRENEEVDANRQEIEGLVRTRTKVYPKTPEQLCEAKEKRGMNKKQPTLEERREGLPLKGL